MKIHIEKFIARESPFAMLMVHALWEGARKAGVDFEKVYFPTEGDKTIEVKITANGIELDPESFIEALWHGYEKYIEEKSKELVLGKISKLEDKLYTLKEAVNNHLDDICKELPQDAWYAEYLKNKKD